MNKFHLIILLLFTKSLIAQERIVFGVVRDSLGVIPGANVGVKGTMRGVQTDFDGKYAIKATPNEVLEFSFTGYTTQTIKADQSELNVTLKEGVRLQESVGPPITVKNKRPEIYAISTKDLKQYNDPKYHFKLNSRKNVYVLYVNPTEVQYSDDRAFQDKYGVSYTMIGGHSTEFAAEFNKLTFKYLNKKFGKEWQTQTRTDVVGLTDFLK